MLFFESNLYKQNLRQAKNTFRSSIIYSENNLQADDFLEGEGFTDFNQKTKILQELFRIEIVSSSFGPNYPKPRSDYHTLQLNYWDLLTMIRFKKERSYI